MTTELDQPVGPNIASVISKPDVSVQLRTPVNLLAAIPHLLGFQPVSSLVIVGTDPSLHEVRVTIRYELPDPPGSSITDDILEHATSVLTTQRATRAIVVGYGSSHLVTPVIDKMRESSPPARLTLAEVLRVENGRYCSYLCHRPDCCPADGTPFVLNADPVAAALAAPGSPVFASREELADTVAAVSGKAAASMRRATQRAEERANQPGAITATGLEALAKAIGRYRSGGQLSPGIDAACLTLVLRDCRIRDMAWSQMVSEHQAAHQRLWTDLARLARPGYVAAPASLLAFVAWASGNGALANVALDRALADNPQYSMARHLRQVINAGVPPEAALAIVRDAAKLLDS